MAGETIKLPVRPILAVGLAGLVSFVGAAVVTPPDPVSMLIVALPCFVLQVAANLALLLGLRSWSLGKATALAALADGVIVLGVWGVLLVL